MDARSQRVAWRLHPYRLRLARAYVWAGGTQRVREGALVSVDGGWGEIAYAPGAPFDAARIEAMLRAAAAGGDGLDPVAIPDTRVRCGAATAALDTAARASGQRLCGALDDGASVARPHVAVNALIVGDADIQDQVDAARAAGIDVLKIKCGADRAADVARVAAVRHAAPTATLRLDANGAWSADWAADHMRQLAAFGIDYVEQPFAPAQVEAAVHLAAKAPFEVAIDESATDVAAIARLVRAGAATVVILKPQRLGGPVATVAAMRVAEDEGARVVVTNSIETSVGVHAALHCASLLRVDEACGLATSAFLAEDVAAAPRIHAGRMRVPAQPGLGIDPVVPVHMRAPTASAGPRASRHGLEGA